MAQLEQIDRVASARGEQHIVSAVNSAFEELKSKGVLDLPIKDRWHYLHSIANDARVAAAISRYEDRVQHNASGILIRGITEEDMVQFNKYAHGLAKPVLDYMKLIVQTRH